jgi:hypothetical protein
MPQGPNVPYTNLDQNQILQRSFDESQDRLRVDAEVTAVIGTVECVIDASSGDNISISDGNDTLGVNPDGSINVNVVTSTAGEYKVIYGEKTAVASGVTETLISFSPVANSRLVQIDVSGTNIATYELYQNSAIINKKRTNFGSSLNESFSFDGLMLGSGDNITISVVHPRPYDGDFNATLKYIEV